MASKGKILIVDDSDFMLEAVSLTLEEAGFEVVTLNNPLSVAHLLRQASPDLVLIDVNMPAISGDFVTKMIQEKNLNRSMPVLLHSDLPAEKLQALVTKCGASGFIRKTSDAAEFVRQVSGWVTRKSAAAP